MKRPLRVFLCHASQDKPAVRKLYDALNSEWWIDPWLDKAKILPGQDWEMVIEKAVDESDVVLVCLSQQAVSKEGYVQREIRYAYDIALEKPENTIFLIPLRLDDCDVPRKLRTLHWVNYFGAEKEDAYSDLLAALKYRYEQKITLEDGQKPKRSEEPFERKPVPPKPFTKVLDPSSLNPSKPPSSNKPIQRSRYWLAGVIVLLFALGGYGLNSLLNKSPDETPAPASPISTKTAGLPSETVIPASPTLTETPAPTATPTTVLGIGSSSRSLKDDMLLVYVPAGEFTMGSEDGNEDEKPVHQVFLDAFWIDQTEVTNKMYAKCVDANQCNPPRKKSSATHNPYYGNSDFDDYPVIYVSWSDASAYCSFVGRTLPTEAQWEKAARGTDGRTYPWGDIAPKDTLLNYDNIIKDTTEVGSYPEGASIYGALDMAGNVWEWTNDWYSETYYSTSLTSNPFGPDSGQYRVLRGGSWDFSVYGVHSAYRGRNDPTLTFDSVGFRCALSKP